MRNVFVVFALLFSASALAANTYDLEASFATDLVDRGVSESDGSNTVGAALTLNNLAGTDGFVTLSGNTWSLGGSFEGRGRATGGFAGDLGVAGLGYTVALSRTNYFSVDAANYTEVVLGLDRSFGDLLTVYGLGRQIVSDSVSKDTYLELGGRLNVTPRIWTEVAAAGVRDRETTTFRYNHTEAALGLSVASRLDVYAKQVFGHSGVDNVSVLGANFRF